MCQKLERRELFSADPLPVLMVLADQQDFYYREYAETRSSLASQGNDFLADDKHVAAICHGVTVLAWARVDGVSPISGRQVAVPTTVSSPD